MPLNDNKKTKPKQAYPNRPWIPQERYAELAAHASRAELLEVLAIYVKRRSGKSGLKSEKLSPGPRRLYRPLLSPEEYRLLSTDGTREHVLARIESFVPRTGDFGRSWRSDYKAIERKLERAKAKELQRAKAKELKQAKAEELKRAKAEKLERAKLERTIKRSPRILLEHSEFQQLVVEGSRSEIVQTLSKYVHYPHQQSTFVGKINRILLTRPEFDQLVSRSKRTELLRRLEYYARRNRGPRYADQEETPAAVRMRRSRDRRRDPSKPKPEYRPKTRKRESLPWVRRKMQKKKVASKQAKV